MIRKITEEQEKQISFYIKKWLDLAEGKTDRKVGEKVVKDIYKKMGEKEPLVIWGHSPFSTALMVGLFNLFLKHYKEGLKNQFKDWLDSQLYSQLDSELYSQLDSELGSQLRSELDSELGSQLRSQLYSQLYSQLRSQLYSQLDSQLRSQLDSQFKKINNNRYLSLYWNDWACYYDYTCYLGVKFDQEKLNLFLNYLAHVQFIIPYQNIAFVSDKPLKIHWQNKRLHNAEGKSVEYSDGWGIYSWKGIKVPEKYIMHPDQITQEEFLKEENIERKRCLIEKMGMASFVKMMGLIEIDKDIVGEKEAITYRTKEKDNLLGDYLYFLKVIDPSSERIYFHSIPPERAKNVWEAVAKRWGKTKETYKPLES